MRTVPVVPSYPALCTLLGLALGWLPRRTCRGSWSASSVGVEGDDGGRDGPREWGCGSAEESCPGRVPYHGADRLDSWWAPRGVHRSHGHHATTAGVWRGGRVRAD